LETKDDEPPQLTLYKIKDSPAPLVSKTISKRLKTIRLNSLAPKASIPSQKSMPSPLFSEKHEEEPSKSGEDSPIDSVQMMKRRSEAYMDIMKNEKNGGSQFNIHNIKSKLNKRPFYAINPHSKFHLIH
jgi:hypothetical protein